MTKESCFRSPYKTLIALLLIAVAIPAAGQAQKTNRPAAAGGSAAPARPKLVLVIMVDQFRYDFLERYFDLFGRGGFRRLMEEGAFFTNANFGYLPTYTAPGHAAVFTGAGPAQNGIVGNSWFDRESGTVRVMVSDKEARLLTEKGAAAQSGTASPRSLVGTTIGDQIRLASNFQSKVIAISFKDRSAVLPGGKRPNGAYWFNEPTGAFVTSDYYFKELPGWVTRFNAKERPDMYFGASWDRALPPESYNRAQAVNGEGQGSTLGKRFPYKITGGADAPGVSFYRAFQLTPFASEYLAAFGKAAIEAESLGADPIPDLLSISFSSPDLAGHSYGPDSQEVLDLYVRLDRVIADLLSYVDRRIGLANTLIAVTGDHGVAPVPEYMKQAGFDAARIKPAQVVEAVNRALKERFGDERWVLSFINEQFYFDQKLIKERGVDPAQVERVAGEAALTVPGIIDYYTRTQIVEGRVPASSIGTRIINGFNRARSGDLWLITKPYFFVTEGMLATTHGSPYSYDTHVPLILFGRGVRPGRYHNECSPSDIAPTIAALLGIEPPPGRVGRVLPVAGVD